MKKVNIILPVYNEEAVIDHFNRALISELDKLKDKYQFEIIYIIDKSSDKTLEIAKKFIEKNNNIKLVTLSKRFGHQMSLVAGMDQCDGDAVIMMDSDLQHPPSLIRQLLEKFEEGYDIVHTTRLDSDDASFLKRRTSKMFYQIINFMSDVEISKSSADFRLISKKVLTEFKTNIREQNQFLRGLFHWVGYNQTYVKFKASERFKGTTKYNVLKLFNFAANGIISFSNRPLRMAIFSGLILSGLNFLYILYILAVFLLINEIPNGWVSLALVISLIGGVQLIFLGVIGEYIGNIFEQTKGRPLYIVDTIYQKDNDDKKN
ncbi:MAG: glycosyltransferase family 2 protein [Pseudomonadota bacterium]